ncbi:MAG: peroxiredoxin [Flavobacteriales bacterium]|nr:peroxiredoxin [Flavobacteriales bacterium]
MGKSKLSIGDKIPEFELLNQNNELVRISPTDGKKRIIYFYPKDDTRFCTEQACSFRDWQTDLTEKGYEVIGISGDSPADHLKFQANHTLNFTLLSDKGGKVRKLFGASNLLGLIPARKTFLVNEKGVVEFEYEAMFEGEGHIDQLKKYIK